MCSRRRIPEESTNTSVHILEKIGSTFFLYLEVRSITSVANPIKLHPAAFP